MSHCPQSAVLRIALIACGLAGSAFAENRVLFIGNSFTIGSGESVAEIFDALAIAGGQDDPLTVLRADGGKDYEWHSTNAPTQNAITSHEWTHVIIQNFSTEPTHITTGGVADHVTFGTALYDQIIANNEATQVILFETWSRAANHALITGNSTPTTFADTAEMQRELRDNYQALANTLTTDHPDNLPVRVGPVGDAWENAGGLLPTTDPAYVSLHGGDRYHGNDNGYFLAAAVFYATIYGISPEGLHTKPAVTALNLTITEDTAALERVAWETVSQAGVLRFASAPESLTVEENQPATFKANIRGAGPYTIQWFQDGEEITDATGLSYTISSAGPDLDGSVFTVTVTNTTDSITSEPATLSVQIDKTPPTLEKATKTDDTTLELEFSEPITLSPEAKLTVVNQGKRIPLVGLATPPEGTKIILTLASPLAGGFVIEVASGVTDSNGNILSNGAPFVSPGASPFGEAILIDFGSAGAVTEANDDSARSWNNLSSAGTSDTGTLESLRTVAGTITEFGLQMVRRFNGANSSGSTVAANFPPSATGDSLFGNTATFSGLADVFPAFQLTGLNPEQAYQLTFYASRTGVSDNRETLYTVTGSAVSTTTLNPVGNVDRASTLGGLIPDSNGDLLIEISPSPKNTNSNQFTYLGVLEISSPPTSRPILHQPVPLGENIIIDWSGVGRLETSPALEGHWTPISPPPVPPHLAEVAVSKRKFFRIRYQGE